MVEGVSVLGKVLQKIHTAISECKQESYNVISKFESVSEQFIEPFTFAYYLDRAILVNEKQIYNEIMAAVQDWKNGDWVNSGINVGKAILIVSGEKAAPEVQMGRRMVKQ